MDKYDDLTSVIKNYNNVIIGGHKWLDFDSIGACLALNEVCSFLGVNSKIIIPNEEHEKGVAKIIKEVSTKYTHINLISQDDLSQDDLKNTLLLICDCNSADVFCAKELIDFCDTAIIDHHNVNPKTIYDTVYSWISSEYSSTCEMMVEVIDNLNINISSFIASALLAGIIVDTNSFNVKVHKNTFYNSGKLMNMGASLNLSRYLFKEDLETYRKRQSLIANTKLINNFAVTVGDDKCLYRKEDLSKCAEELINFENVEASFVIANIDTNLVAISARSYGNLSIHEIMIKFGGGGHKNEAGAQIENKKIIEIKEDLIKYIKELL